MTYRTGSGVGTIGIAMNTDYKTTLGNPEKYLRRIAESGFSHVNWCHHWNDDYFYTPREVRRSARLLRDTGLVFLDHHASEGFILGINSSFEPRRRFGKALLRNRIEMIADMGGNTAVLHILTPAGKRTLEEMEPLCRNLGVRIAAENLARPGHADFLTSLLAEHDPTFLGICYDSGHGNLTGNGLDRLEEWKHRLIALHTNDNRGLKDDHLPPMHGTADWKRFAEILSRSSYRKPICLECTIENTDFSDESDFLTACRTGAENFAAMVETGRSQAD